MKNRNDGGYNHQAECFRERFSTSYLHNTPISMQRSHGNVIIIMSLRNVISTGGLFNCITFLHDVKSLIVHLRMSICSD